MYGIHLTKNPAGTYSFVGDIPISLCILDVATKADVMAGRAFKDRYGVMVAPKTPCFSSIDEGVKYAKAKGHSVLVGNILV